MKDIVRRRLEDPKSWDFDRAVERPAGTASRAVVSVAFPRADFQRVAQCADQLGKKVSEFIREAAVERAVSQIAMSTQSYSSNSSASLFTAVIHSNTTAHGHGRAISRVGDAVALYESELAETF